MTNANNILPNGNDELLSWAVENVAEWNDSYTHLRSDNSNKPIFYTKGENWEKRGSKSWLYLRHTTRSPSCSRCFE